MQHYHLRGYEMKLLGELQKQQNSAQFCDTLLQTDGISVPTHSCVLAALSPYLSQKLLATPYPPPGQKRQLQLQPLKAHTLLKLVGLLYSGELEVKGSVEQNDLMDAVRTFGITPLIERPRNEATMDEELQKNHVGSFSKCCKFTNAGREKAKCRIIKDALVHIETAVRKDTDRSVEKKSCVSTGTQTPLENQTKPLTPEHIRWPTQNIPLDVCVTRSHQSSVLITNAMSNGEVSSHWTASSDTDTSFSQRPQHRCFDSVGSTHVLTQTKGNSKTSRDQVKKKPEDKNANSAETRPAVASIAKKNLAKMKLMESTQFSVKVKLRRRTKEKVWEVVSTQDEDDTVSVFASLSEESHQSAAQSSHNHIAQVEPSNSTKPPIHPNTISEPSHHFIDHTAQHQNGTLQSAPVPQPQGLAEESDEQIEKMLEDIMMGLNILPALEAPEDDTGQSKMLSDAPSAESPRYQIFGEQSVHMSTCTAQNQLNFKSVPLLEPSGVIMPQQPFLQALSSASSMGQIDRLSQHDRTYPPFQERQPLSSFSPTCFNDMQLPRCLSPIEPFTSVGIDEATTNEHQSSRCARPLLTEQSLLVFPLSDGEDKRPPLSKRHQSKLPKQCLKQLEYEPQQSRNCALSCIKNKMGMCPTAAERKAYPQRIKRTLVHNKGVTTDGNVVPKKRKVCVDYPKGCSSSICDDLRSKKNIRICSVSLSRNNVLAKERKMATGSPKSPPSCSGKHDQQSTTNDHLKKRTRSTGPKKLVNTRQSHIKTRVFLKTTQVPPSDTCTQSITDTNSEVHSPTVASNTKVSFFKKKRGRPPKKAALPVILKSEIQEKMEEELLKINLEKSDKIKGKGPKIRNGRGEEQVVPLKSIKNAAKSDDDSAPKSMVAFTEFQTFVKTQHLKKKKSAESQEAGKNVLNGDNHEDNDFIQLQVESPVNVSVSTGQNPNQVLNKSTDEREGLQQHGSGRSSGKGTTSRDEHSLEDVVKRSVAQHAEMDQTPKIQELNFVVMPNKHSNPGCSPSDRQPCPQNQMSLEPNMNPQISTCSSPAAGAPNSPESSQEGVIEVDALLSSPEKLPVIRQCEYALGHTDTTQSEEEGEIDVTGDEMG
ncbi:uncharacterized protein LOC133476505 [Phyllopteryx taeniolatus]|uniref:uncharacterized protein LOC133476505 n=1 Tax=Phyllopteryx taeniolatus TaxID=161469 RepID=UPI002AD490FC|nr:uncharacterized protein LOC133476505 [Phyllopteryx taeniolatus]